MKWAEFNITPRGSHDEFLAKAVAPFISANDPESWHFFWEPGEAWKEGEKPEEPDVCRFRLLAGKSVRESFRHRLQRMRSAGAVRSWYQGAHGKRGERYSGEQGFYGDRVWEATYRLWHAHSRLALLLAVQAQDGTLQRPASFHWRRTAHLTANQLSLPDIRLNLEQAQRYLFIKDQYLQEKLTEAESRLLAQLDTFLYAPEVI